MKFVYDDGGREKAGYTGHAGDCVCRAICIAAGLPYQQVYDRLARGNADQRPGKRERVSKRGVRTARSGINVKRQWFKDYMRELGFRWVPTMKIGSGCKVHLHDGELPAGRLVVSVSKHYTAVLDGVVHDTHDPQRDAHSIRVLTEDEALKPGEWELKGDGGIINIVNGVKVRPRQAASVQRRCVYGYWILDAA